MMTYKLQPSALEQEQHLISENDLFWAFLVRCIVLHADIYADRSNKDDDHHADIECVW